MNAMMPIWAKERTAARLCDQTPADFRDLVNKGIFPKPEIRRDGVELWRVSSLEKLANGKAAIPEEQGFQL